LKPSGLGFTISGYLANGIESFKTCNLREWSAPLATLGLDPTQGFKVCEASYDIDRPTDSYGLPASGCPHRRACC